MKIHQLSVFLENKPGRLSEPCRVLADANISMLTLSVADTEQFGILRVIVEEWEKARDALQSSGAVVNVAEVVAVEVADRPGGLAEVLEMVEDDGINIEYMYAFTFRRQDRAVLVFRFEDPDAAIDALNRGGFNVVGRVELFNEAQQ